MDHKMAGLLFTSWSTSVLKKEKKSMVFVFWRLGGELESKVYLATFGDDVGELSGV